MSELRMTPRVYDELKSFDEVLKKYLPKSLKEERLQIAIDLLKSLRKLEMEHE